MIRGEGKGCTLIDFTITKQLTKDINKYPNDKGQPHVHVAKRMIEKGNKGMSLTHHYIPYVIIKNDKVSIILVVSLIILKEGLGEKAIHPDEYKNNSRIQL